MKFLFIISHGSDFRGSPELISSIQRWVAAAEKTGVLVHGNPLKPPNEAITVKIRDDKLCTVPGPASTNDEMIAAYTCVECEDMDTALSMAATHPMAAAATIEVRPIWEELTH
jgi:hypothetical protein